MADQPVYVIRASIFGQIPGTGASDASGRVFRFPTVGSPFEWPGPELRSIKSNGNPYPNDFEGRQLHTEGIHGYLWGLSGEPEFQDQCRNWRLKGMDHWIVLEVHSKEDIAFDKGRTSGKCRVKRGTVAFVGDIAGAVEFMRSHWPEGEPMPRWEESALFPAPDPTIALREANRLRDEQYDRIMAQRGGHNRVPRPH